MGNESDEFEELRYKDKEVLMCIRQEKNSVHQIKRATPYSRREINYCFTKLEQRGFIEIERQEGWVDHIVDGQRRKHQKPKKAVLTEKGQRFFKVEKVPETNLEELSRGDLLAHIERLEEYVNELVARTDMVLGGGEDFDELLDRIQTLSGRQLIEESDQIDPCVFCGEDNEMVLQQHHLLPRRYGGTDEQENLVVVCANCHHVIERVYDDSFFQKVGLEKFSMDDRPEPILEETPE